MYDEKFFNLLKRELIVALGCTEPNSIAYAAALAKHYAKGNQINKVEVIASRNVIKNAMSVGIPGTDSCGINLAAALGIFAENLDKNLEVLANIKDHDIRNAQKMVENGLITVQLADSPKLYVEVIVKTEESYSRVIIEDIHNNVVLIEVNGKNIVDIQKNMNKQIFNYETTEEDHDFLNMDSILEFINHVDIKKLDLIRESIDLNKKICLEGLNKPYGLRVGSSIKTNMENGFISDIIMNYATALTAAGSDARMAGSVLPVMSNSGSGNQGISATIPVVAFAEKLNSDEDTLIRGVVLSNLITIYIKLFLGRLSALCGATIAATGASCGITYIMGGGEKEIKSSLQNMLGNITGIICDGAKAGCALKVATCTTAAIQSTLITLEGNTIKPTNGIIEKTLMIQ
ncbi:MAG: L-serine ammonia-lyase, iron-sulfur-dependent, subunit alpha [Methanobacterium sp.]|nr:L-serine ammonia-lyase, iron-sulfur-dependent, subunit alpha [Methanobacterium sp.]